MRGYLILLSLQLIHFPLKAGDYFVAPEGTPFGNGTPSAPYDLLSALSGILGGAGDTFWLRGGDYHLGHLVSSVHGLPDAPLTFRQVRGERARVDATLTLFNSPGYVVFRDFELYSSDTNRLSSQIGVGFNVTDITILPGIGCYSPNMSFINLVIHDQTRHGIYTSQTASNVLIYGCIIFNNGWASPDNAEGHGIYAQGQLGTRTLAENLIFNNAGGNVHVYENGVGKFLCGVNLEGNVAFHAGALQNVRAYRDWIVGVDAPALYTDQIQLKHNLGYAPGPVNPRAVVQLGRDATNGSIVLEDNYLPLGLVMSNWHSATVCGNFIAPQVKSDYAVALDESLCNLNAVWDNNTYLVANGGNQVLLNSGPCSFFSWQVETGFDLGSTFALGSLLGTRVFLRTNAYEQGRAQITVYNWDQAPVVSVDLRAVLSPGCGFELRNVQDWFAEPVLRGVYQGQMLQLPMTNLTVAAPTAPLLTPAPTGPEFNTFLLQLVPEAVRISRLPDAVEVSWPIGAGADGLVCSDSVAPPGVWTSPSTTPGLAGDRYTISEPTGAQARFYRLRDGMTH